MIKCKKHSDSYTYPISIFVITSSRDEPVIIKFLKTNNFYHYENLSVCFQDDLAIINRKGKVVLKDKKSVLKNPNGTGGVFKTMMKYGLGKFVK